MATTKTKPDAATLRSVADTIDREKDGDLEELVDWLKAEHGMKLVQKKTEDSVKMLGVEVMSRPDLELALTNWAKAARRKALHMEA